MVPNWLPLNRINNCDFFFSHFSLFLGLFDSKVLCRLHSTMNWSPWNEPRDVLHDSKYKPIILKHNRYYDVFLIQEIAHNPFTVLKKKSKVLYIWMQSAGKCFCHSNLVTIEVICLAYNLQLWQCDNSKMLHKTTWSLAWATHQNIYPDSWKICSLKKLPWLSYWLIYKTLFCNINAVLSMSTMYRCTDYW